MRTDRTARMLAGLLATALVLASLTACVGSASTGSGGTVGRQVAPSQGRTTEYGTPVLDAAAPGSGQKASSSPASSLAADRMVIRNANVRLEVPKVQAAVARIRSLAKASGGVVSNLQLASDTGGGGTPLPVEDGSGRVLSSGLPFSAQITVLVPVAKFDAFRTDAEKLGKLLSETSADDDVTQAHADLAARLKNAQAEEARLRSFFDKAKDVSDMLSIEKELARVRGEIESMDAQLKTMERQAAMATLTIELVEPQPIVRPSNGIDWGFADALTTGIQAMSGLLRGIIVIGVATAPLWILAIVAVLLVRWRLRVRKARREAAGSSEA